MLNLINQLMTMMNCNCVKGFLYYVCVCFIPNTSHRFLVITMEWEDRCLVHILNDRYRKYCFDIDQLKGLTVEGNWLLSFSEYLDSGVQCVLYNMKTKVVKMSRKDNKDSAFILFNDCNKQSDSVIDLANDGMLLEGTSLNNLPFGYGSLYNDDNELVYRGVMIKNKKECFGTVFFNHSLII